jgi:AraC family transcriptional regulator of adaptative response / DNA-3-methyladenine glycosylase II
MARARTVAALAAAVVAGEVALEPGADRVSGRAALLDLPGIGPWTVEYIAMRVLRDPDAFLASDLGVRRALEARGHDGRPAAAAMLAERWRPFRATANQHLWAASGHTPRR